MNRAVMPITDYENTCDKIREKTETTDLIKSGEMPEKIEEVYEAGQVTGQKTEYDRFWDVIQKKGDSVTTDYAPQNGVFNGRIFNFANFYPKYDIRPVGSAGFLFYAWEKRENIQGSLTERLKECGVVLDTSQATNLTHIFNYGRFTELPTIDFSSVTEDSTGCFANNWGALKTIEKIIVHENLKYPKWFDNSSALENVTFEGVIGQNGLSFANSPLLTEATLRSIIGCLKDFRAMTTIATEVTPYEHTTITNGTLEEGKQYTWSYYDSMYPGWVSDDATSYPTSEEVQITSTAEKIIIGGNEYVGFKASYMNYVNSPHIAGGYEIYVYQDGNEIKTVAYNGAGEDNIIKLNILTAPTETRSITFHADSVTKLETLTEGGKTLKQIANDKGWTVIEA